MPANLHRYNIFSGVCKSVGTSSSAGVNRGRRCILLCRRSLLTPTKVSVPASTVAAGESTFPGVCRKRHPCYSHHQRPLKTPAKTFADSIISGGKN
ncbi:hypothetical protein FH972_019714 [Carpinus fangiana]|uniref:Uncharacterized protein n=1 Tax=Carpinus fangiana TaxID=176857 RepID=A0A5N6RSG9_9ROSI|nr:hypothetical protein FH972_019714 [Carpinus fangiana]